MKTWHVMTAGGVLGVIVAIAVVSTHHHPATQGPNTTVAAVGKQSSQNQTQNTTQNATQNSTQSTSNATSNGSSNQANNTTNANQPSSNGTTGAASPQVQKALSTVAQMLQKPTPKSMDASGFVQYVFGQAGVSLPRTIAQQAQVGSKVSGQSNLQPGDLVFFNLDNNSNSVTFDGIYLGNDKFAALTTHGLEAISLSNSYWSGKFLFGERVS